ncbi:GDP-mannose 4,6-dehydratase [Flavobacterium sp.]|uniref:GDP-mannose 4,6-dehydratase n=1 Tax=Flavobacterium sp. TaxID=239 RepID=UPI003752DC2A
MIKKTAIISGITGQDGAYLAELLLNKGYKVVGLTRLNYTSDFSGLNYLGIQDKILIYQCDLLNIEQIIQLFEEHQPTEFYNLAAQSSVYQSFVNPVATFQFNTISVFNLLEVIKKLNKDIRFYQASSSEMYGRVNNLPISENSILHPLSPYAISKASAHFTCIYYRESYNMHVSCGILFNHESYLRQNTFFVKKIIIESIKISKGQQKLLYVGNIDIKRDFGYAPKYVEAMYLMLQQEKATDYLICSGKSITLREIIYYIFKKLNISKTACKVSNEFYRPSEIEDMFGNNSKAKLELNWQYDLTVFETLDLLLEEELRNDK